MGHAQSAWDGAETQREAAEENGPPSDSTGQRPPSPVDRIVGSYRAVMKFLGRRALARATRAVPRTLRFMYTAARSGEVSAAVPAPKKVATILSRA